MTTTMKQEMQAFIEVMDEFSQLLQQETAALKAMDIKHVDALQVRKFELSRLYQQRVETLAARRGELVAVELPLREHLVKKRTLFNGLLNDNARALETMRQSARRLSDRILEATRRAVGGERQTSYSAQGQHYSAPSSMLSIRMDQTL